MSAHDKARRHGAEVSTVRMQAVEAKEGVMIRGDNVTYASITYMVFFSMFENLAGMTVCHALQCAVSRPNCFSYCV